MNLCAHYPYSLLGKGIINSYPSLQKNMRCNVAIIGAGITGGFYIQRDRRANNL